MWSNEEIEQMPLSFFETDGYSPQDMIDSIRILAMEEVEVVSVGEDQLPVVRLII